MLRIIKRFLKRKAFPTHDHKINFLLILWSLIEWGLGVHMQLHSAESRENSLSYMYAKCYFTYLKLSMLEKRNLLSFKSISSFNFFTVFFCIKYNADRHSSEIRCLAWWNALAKLFKICHIFEIRKLTWVSFRFSFRASLFFPQSMPWSMSTKTRALLRGK